MTSTIEATTADGITLTEQQAEGSTKVQQWYADPTRQIFRLFGYAGTGKSTTVAQIVHSLGIEDVQYAAYTGKAAYVLRTKGNSNASTIHSLIYLPSEKARHTLNQLVKQLEVATDPDERAVLERRIAAEERKLANPDWILRDQDETDLYSAKLLVIDEVSMVGERVALDLLSYGVKTLVLGDPAQLPPVDGAGWFIDAQPDHLLTEVLRSALDSPVTRIATTIRGAELGTLEYGVTGPDGDSGRYDGITIESLLSADQVLVGTNKTRWQAIHLLRALRGLYSPMPTCGDRIMILANSGSAEVFNGQQFDVLGTYGLDDRPDRIGLEVQDDEGGTRDLVCWRAGFTGVEGETKAKREGRGSVAAATFGQAVTVHKAQGSQWDKVVVVDESSVFASIEAKTEAQNRRKQGLPDHGHSAQAGHVAGRRWLYTAATRAARQIVILPRLAGAVTS